MNTLPTAREDWPPFRDEQFKVLRPKEDARLLWMRLKVPLSSISALVMDQGCCLGLSGEYIWLLQQQGGR